MKTIFIGIDVSKDTLDVAICDAASKATLDTFQVKNSLNGINQMAKRVSKFGSSPWFCFEHTGNYGLLLAHQLQTLDLTYTMVPALEIKKSQGMVRGKTDAVDSVRIAHYAAIHAHKLTPSKLAGEKLLQIKSLLSYRAQLTGMMRQLKNSLKSYQVMSQSVNVQTITDDVAEQIEKLTEKVKYIEEQIVTLINSDDSLLKNYSKTVSVKGVGLIIAAYMLVYTKNFTAFDNPRKFNCYAGLAPFEYQSGTSIKARTKTSRLRNKTMKTLLFNGANTAVNCDPELKAYFKRKANEGKPNLLIINNIASKLVYRIFAVVKREEPYVTLVR